MTTCLVNNCLFGVLSVSFVNVFPSVCVLHSLLVLRVECEISLYFFLIIVFFLLFIYHNFTDCINSLV